MTWQCATCLLLACWAVRLWLIVAVAVVVVRLVVAPAKRVTFMLTHLRTLRANEMQIMTKKHSLSHSLTHMPQNSKTDNLMQQTRSENICTGCYVSLLTDSHFDFDYL